MKSACITLSVKSDGVLTLQHQDIFSDLCTSCPKVGGILDYLLGCTTQLMDAHADFPNCSPTALCGTHVLRGPRRQPHPQQVQRVSWCRRLLDSQR